MTQDFAALDAMHQMTPTNMDALDARMAFQSDGQQVAHAGDDKLFVRFYNRSVKDDAESEKQGRAIFKDQVYINIKIPGDKHNDVNRPAFQFDFQRFPLHYERFRKNQEQVVGTPLSVVPFLTEAQVDEYQGLSVRTVEQLAGLADVVCQRIMGAVTHKQKAQQFLEGLKSTDAVRAEFQDRINKQDKEMADLRTQIEKLTAKTK